MNNLKDNISRIKELSRELSRRHELLFREVFVTSILSTARISIAVIDDQNDVVYADGEYMSNIFKSPMSYRRVFKNDEIKSSIAMALEGIDTRKTIRLNGNLYSCDFFTLQSDDEESIIGALLLMVDITAKDSLRSQLNEKTALLNVALSRSALSLLYYDKSGIISAVEAAEDRFMGINKKELLGSNIFDIFKTNEKFIDCCELVLNAEEINKIIQNNGSEYDTTFVPIIMSNSTTGAVITAVKI